MAETRSPQRRLDIKIGFVCNNYCLHCVQGDRRVTFGNKTVAKLFSELESGAKECSDIVFTGGEPTIHPDFIKAVAYAKKLGFKTIQVQSNGRMFNYPEFCKRTVAAGANQFSLALHGHTAQLHDRLTCVPGSFDQTVAGIRALVAMGQRVTTNSVISKVNYRFLPQMATLLVKLGVVQFQFAFPHPSGKAGENFSLIVPRMKSIMPYVKKGLAIGIRAGRRVMTEAIPYCFMRGYEQYIAEQFIPNSKVFDAGYEVEDYTKYRKDEGKLKGPQCIECKYDRVCEGPWREYPEHFGFAEFLPVKR